MNEPLKIVDTFFTLQGEGEHWGRRALFVRMPLCNLSCSWCDTKFDTWNEWSLEDFLKFAESEKTRFAVLTGGDRLMNKQSPLVIQALKSLDYEIAVETNGTFPFLPGIDWVTCSPKKDAAYKVHRLLKPSVDEYKYVVDSDFDFTLLDRHKDEEVGVSLRLSPEWGERDKNMPLILDYIRENPRWKLNLQTHKVIGVP